MPQLWTSHHAATCAPLSTQRNQWSQNLRDNLAQKRRISATPLFARCFECRGSRCAESAAKKRQPDILNRVSGRSEAENLQLATENCLIHSAGPALRPHAGGSSRAASPCPRRSFHA